MVAVERRPVTVDTALWLHDATAAVRAVDALAEAGVFDRLHDAPATTVELADHCDLDLDTLEVAIDVARLAGLVDRVDGRWRVDTMALRMVLAPGAVSSALHGRAPTDNADPVQAGEQYAERVELIADYSRPYRAALVDVLGRPGQHVLEIGAGAAPWGRALCDADPTTTVTAVDLPAVLATTRRSVARDEHTERFDFVAADVFEPHDLGPADLVVVSGLCRLVSAERNRALFEQAYSWCVRGGRVAVVDAVATAATRAAGLSRYEIGLRTRTSEGRCWTLDHYAGWLTAAGFAGVDFVTTDRPEISLVTASRGAT